jgi:hypothetical protein
LMNEAKKSPALTSQAPVGSAVSPNSKTVVDAEGVSYAATAARTGVAVTAEGGRG